jgi:hypothetical protein
VKYRDLAENILDYVRSQEGKGNHIPEWDSLSYFGVDLFEIEGIIEDFMRKEEYSASE